MEFCEFSKSDQQTWQKLYSRLVDSHKTQAHPMFAEGLKLLGITGEEIPSIIEVNKKLKKISGWQAVAAEGLVDGRSFFAGLANKEFPIGNFIRDPEDLSYTPAPDVFHDLYGHIPFFCNLEYAEFCENFGKSALKYAKSDEDLQEYERLFWFGVEFPLIKTTHGLRIFGGGILSSFGECNYSLSEKPRKIPFDVGIIRDKDYRIDIMQDSLFVLDSPSQLYNCLEQLEKKFI